MTKIAVIEYNEVDEALLQLFFQKLSVTFTKTSDPVLDRIESNPKLKKLSKKSKKLLVDMHYAIQECEAMSKGEIEPEQTYQEYLAELKSIANANRALETV